MTDVVDPVALSSWTKDEARDEELTQEQELEKLRAEKKALQMRVLGVNELARLLQERTAELQIMEQKNKRLEVAVVRLENRCSNFEKKMKAQSGALPKSGQMPFIPGPSRQILDSLMLENAELKKVINKQTSKGPTSYLEAVKTYQLEEMVEQQRQDIEFYKAQLVGLGMSEGEDEKAVSMPAAGDPPGISNTRALKLKVAKLQQTMRVKDKFCSLLSDRVALLEKQLSEASSHPPSSDLSQQALTTPPMSLKNMSDSGTQVDGEEVKPRPDELVKLEQERNKFEAEMNKKDNEIKRLIQQNEDLTLYNKTLVDDMKTSGLAGGSGLRTSEQEVEKLQKEAKELRGQLEEVQRRVEKLEGEKRALEDQVEQNDYERAIIESKQTDQERESRSRIQSLTDQVDILREDLDVTKSKLQESQQQRNIIEFELKRIKASIPPSRVPSFNKPMTMMSGGYYSSTSTSSSSLDPMTVKDHKESNQQGSAVDQVIRPPLCMARSIPDSLEPEPTHQLRPQTLPSARPGNTPYPPYHQGPTHSHRPVMPYATGGGGVYHHLPSYSPMTPTYRPPATSYEPSVRTPLRGHTSPVTNHSLPQYVSYRSHPSTTIHPAVQPYQYDLHNPNSSLASMNSSGYFSSGVPSYPDGPQGQSQMMAGPPQGGAGSQQQQQQQGSGYHGHNAPQ